ncbi:CrcB family protein [Streptomyces sp. HNM0575]|uniref:fluoride efflux transporter FluC n=1 Tax=Streptomyces sp. HNM0575 TaxID=2716338 RepID=UPI00145D7DCE|nr:CrcB family protein [Streptomyces sp. HNM0575]NLU76670.1 CrcB family protein [Streptomyces sp. HNM0575]
MPLLLVCLGGLAGAVVRYMIEKSVRIRGENTSHWSAFAVNFAGCFLLGLLVGETIRLGLSSGTMLLAGAVTAFSVFGYETLRLLQHGLHGQAGLRALAGWLTGTAAAAAGVVVIMA